MVSYIRGTDNFDSEGVGKNANAGAVGSYCFAGLRTFTLHDIPLGTTTAGSNLAEGGVFAYASWGGTDNGVNLEDGTHTGVYQTTSPSLSGTWRCMGNAESYDSNRMPHTLWLRIS